MNTTPKPKRKMLLAAGSIALATAALTFGAAGAANAATGNLNSGIRNIQIVPTAPAAGFATPGTTGTVSWDIWDGVATPNTMNTVPGDVSTRVITLPQGLAWGPGACPANPGTPISAVCTISADGRTRTTTSTTVVATSFPAYTSPTIVSAPVVSTGVITGAITGTYTPTTGTTTAAPTATLPQAQIPGAGVLQAVSGLTASGVNQDGSVVLSGKAQAGSAITITDSTGATVGTATADASGNWSAIIPAGVTPPLTITASLNGVTSAPVTFNEAPLPVLNPAVALGVLALAGAGIGGTVLVRRRRQQHVATA